MVNKRTGMKVIRVEPGSPAQKAGIEIGDVIVAANGVPVTGVEVLSAVLNKSGSSLTVTVRDTRTGRDVPVEVKVGGPDAANPAPIPTDTPIQADSGRKLGAVTELVFYDVDPAVKVTEVEPNSPAARAGSSPAILSLRPTAPRSSIPRHSTSWCARARPYSNSRSSIPAPTRKPSSTSTWAAAKESHPYLVHQAAVANKVAVNITMRPTRGTEGFRSVASPRATDAIAIMSTPIRDDARSHCMAAIPC